MNLKFTRNFKEEVGCIPELLVGIPKIYWAGVEGEFNVMVIDLLGPNLEKLKCDCGGMLSLCTTIMVALQIVSDFH